MATRKKYITDFDSSTCTLFALSHFLRGKDFRSLGFIDPLFEHLFPLMNHIPKRLRVAIYRWSGWLGAVPKSKIKQVDSEDMARWVVSQYPKKKYPAIMIGSSNGAAMHLCAALGIPWIPQTYLFGVRRFLHPDDVASDVEFGRQIVSVLSPRNPDLSFYQMHDPLQDRLMISKMAYFRLKFLKLGPTYEAFIKENLEPGGTILTLECQYPWLLHPIGPKHTFQIGGLGGFSPEDYLNGGEKVDRFLREQKVAKSKVRQWRLDIEPKWSPESEWGFDPLLHDDCERFAVKNDYLIKRLRFRDPEDLSPLAADLYQAWYENRGIAPTRRLVAENFVLVEPYWTIKTGSIPFWLAFNTRSSHEALKKYMESGPLWNSLYCMLMCNGVENAADLVMPPEWRELMKRTRQGGDFLGLTEKLFPLDFATFVRYYYDFKEKIHDRFPWPAPLSLAEFYEFLNARGGNYAMKLGPEVNAARA